MVKKVIEGRVTGNNLRCHWKHGEEEPKYDIETSACEFRTVDELGGYLNVEVDGFLPIGVRVRMTIETLEG